MSGSNELIPFLFGFTLLAVLVIGVVMYGRARKSQAKRGEHPGDALPGHRLGGSTEIPQEQQPR